MGSGSCITYQKKKAFFVPYLMLKVIVLGLLYNQHHEQNQEKNLTLWNFTLRSCGHLVLNIFTWSGMPEWVLGI